MQPYIDFLVVRMRLVSLIAQSGLQFDLSTSQGKLIASVMAVLAEFERDLLPNVSVRESQRRELAEFFVLNPALIMGRHCICAPR